MLCGIRGRAADGNGLNEIIPTACCEWGRWDSLSLKALYSFHQQKKLLRSVNYFFRIKKRGVLVVNRKYLLILTITFLLVDIAFFLFFLTIIDEELPTEVSPPEIVKKKQFENVTLTSDLDLSCSNFCFGQGASLYKTSIYELERVTECACVDEFNQTITLKHYRFDEMTAVEPVPRIRWHNMPLTFNIERKICGDYETRKIRRGIQDVEHQTNNAVTFIETNSSEQAQILFKCEYLVDCYKKSIEQ